MNASGGSQERQPYRIGGSGRADTDGDPALDSATSAERVNVAREKPADQLRAAGASDAAVEAAFREVPPQWWTQLRPSGRIVLPLSIRGIQLSVGLDNVGDHLVSGSACRCSFIKMAGAMSGPESLIVLGPQPGLHARAVDGRVPEAVALYEALSGPAAKDPTGLRASSIAEVADLDLWLTLTEPGLTMDAGLRAISATLAMRAASPREDVTP